MKLRNFLLFAGVCALALPVMAESHQNPGKWQITMQMEAMGREMPPVTITQCVTKEQAEHPENHLPKGARQASDCKMSDIKVDGGTVTWKMECPSQQVTAEGSITYGGDSFTGTMHIKTPQFEGTQKMNGKRLGDCDGTEK